MASDGERYQGIVNVLVQATDLRRFSPVRQWPHMESSSRKPSPPPPGRGNLALLPMHDFHARPYIIQCSYPSASFALLWDLACKGCARGRGALGGVLAGHGGFHGSFGGHRGGARAVLARLGSITRASQGALGPVAPPAPSQRLLANLQHAAQRCAALLAVYLLCTALLGNLGGPSRVVVESTLGHLEAVLDHVGRVRDLGGPPGASWEGPNGENQTAMPCVRDLGGLPGAFWDGCNGENLMALPHGRDLEGPPGASCVFLGGFQW